MVFLRRIVAIACGVLTLTGGTAFSLSTLRPGQPRIKFNRLVAPERAEQGDVFQLSAYVTPLQNIWDDESVFFHLIKPDAVREEYPVEGWQQEGIVINANIAPSIPTKRWIVGEDVQIGPINFEIPYDLPPGDYLYQLGLFYTDFEKGVYLREPYSNREIKDWVVGSLEVKEVKKQLDGKRVEVLLSDFETIGDVKKWESMRRGRIGLVSNALNGNYSGLFGFPARAYLPIVMLESFFRESPPEYTNWSRYDALEFVVRGEFTPWRYDLSNIILQVKDVGLSAGRFQRNLKDIKKATLKHKVIEKKNQIAIESQDERLEDEEIKEELVPRDVYAMRVSIDDIGGRIDTTNIGHLGFFAAGLPPRGDWYVTIAVDDIKLVGEHGLRPDWSEPYIVFEGLDCPESIVAGDVLNIAASFSIARKFESEYMLFVHITQVARPNYSINFERDLFESTVFWKVGKIYREGPFGIQIPHDAPPGDYSINVGFFRALKQAMRPAYVNTYKWADGVYTEVQPSMPIDWIKQPYINTTSRTQWRVGGISILERGEEKTLVDTEEDKKELEELVITTETEIMTRPAPAKKSRGVEPDKPPSYEIKE